MPECAYYQCNNLKNRTQFGEIGWLYCLPLAKLLVQMLLSFHWTDRMEQWFALCHFNVQVQEEVFISKQPLQRVLGALFPSTPGDQLLHILLGLLNCCFFQGTFSSPSKTYFIPKSVCYTSYIAFISVYVIKIACLSFLHSRNHVLFII